MSKRTHTLILDDQRAEVSGLGGRMVAYSVGGRNLLAGRENPELFAFRGALLAPWPNRVVGGRWHWAGQEHSLPVNDPAAGAALHGLVYDAVWEVVRVEPGAIELGYELVPGPGYPFRLQLTATYELTPEGLVCSLSARNTGAEDAPVGLGVHPYIAATDTVDDLVVTIPARTFLDTDDDWRERGRPAVQDVAKDFRNPRRLGDLQLDAAFTDVIAGPDGRTEAVVRLPDGADVVLWSGATCRWWLLYTGHTLPSVDYRRSLAVEPMTCPPNAFNTGEVDVLAPGATLRLDWGLTLR